MNINKVLFTLSVPASLFCTHNLLASPIPCATGDLVKYGTLVQKPAWVRNDMGVPDSAISSKGELIEGVDATHLTSVADIKREQQIVNLSLDHPLGKIKLYCSTGSLGNRQDCERGKKEFLDALAWAYNSKAPIDCKYLKNVSVQTGQKILENPIQFLDKSRFGCGKNGDQLCCASCIKTGFASESNW
jgi:hypothetical protein